MSMEMTPDPVQELEARFEARHEQHTLLLRQLNADIEALRRELAAMYAKVDSRLQALEGGEQHAG